jgi:ribosome-binding ATPase YchF (GTP1/OBG family)
MDQVLFSAAKQLEQQLDSEIDRLDNLSVDDIDAIREKRIKEMKLRQEKSILWKANVSEEREREKLDLLIHQNYF